MSDLEQLHGQMSELMASQARTEETVKRILIETTKTNGRVSEIEIWRKAQELAAAGAEGLRMGRSEAFVTKRQMAFAVGSIGAIAGGITSIVTLIVRFL